MGKFYWCINCEEQDIHDKQRHHYEKHLEMPYNDSFFKPVCEYKNITKNACLVCGYIIESDNYNKKVKKHKNLLHHRRNVADIFDPKKALRCVAIKCSFCKRFIEKGRLNKMPTCPHGSLFEDPNDSIKTPDSQPNGTRKQNDDFSERQIKIPKESEESVEREATSTTVERKTSDEEYTQCNICYNRIERDFLDRHMKRKHPETAIVLDSDSEQDEKPIIKVEKNAGQPTSTPKKIPSTESNERSNQQPCDSETEFYPLRISKSELERFLLAKRIYPKDGNFYLKNS